jgi:hypothetical protein
VYFLAFLPFSFFFLEELDEVEDDDEDEDGDEGSFSVISTDLDLVLRPLEINSNAANAAIVPAVTANMKISSAIVCPIIMLPVKIKHIVDYSL